MSTLQLVVSYFLVFAERLETGHVRASQVCKAHVLRTVLTGLFWPFLVLRSDLIFFDTIANLLRYALGTSSKEVCAFIVGNASAPRAAAKGSTPRMIDMTSI